MGEKKDQKKPMSGKVPEPKPEIGQGAGKRDSSVSDIETDREAQNPGRLDVPTRSNNDPLL